MSRSNPTVSNPSPVERWFEWKGADGVLSWYDKEKKENVAVPAGFRFLVLDDLTTITGYNKKSGGITSNEVRDVRSDELVVKYFKGGVIAKGLWSEIKKEVAYEKGKFARSVYIAFKLGDDLKLGNIRMSGCSVGPWIDFTKEHRNEINSKAVVIKAGQKDTTGDVEFIPPTFNLVETTPETDAKALQIDAQILQPFLASYFGKPKSEQLAKDAPEHHEREPERKEPEPEVPEEDDVPF